MKKPLLSIFADGVRYDSLQYMPFTRKMNSTPLETVLGYSVTCHPSMYSGVNPNKHRIVFHWIKNNKKYGPYFPFSFLPDIFPFSNSYIQAIISYFYSKIILRKKTKAFMGYGKILNLPMKYWNNLEINETKFWDENSYISNDIKTIFELIRENNYKYYISGLYKPNLGELDSIKPVNPKDYNWVYYFIGETDHVSHEFGQHSIEGKKCLLKLDKFIEKEYNKFLNLYGENGFDLIFWSDHGHIMIEKKYDLYSHFNRFNFNLKKQFHIIDSTNARFWVSNKNESRKIKEIMSKIPEAHLVEKKDFKKFNLPDDEQFYGSLFYYLTGGSVFVNTIHGFGSRAVSMHGHHPKDKGSDGVFVSNRKIKSKIATLPDVFVSSINSLGIKYNNKVDLDGKNILSK